MNNKSILYHADYLTNSPSLFIFGNTKLNTKSGVLFSFISFIISLGFALYFLYDFFFKKAINILYTKETYGFKDSFNIDDSLFMVNLFGNFTKKDIYFSAVYLNVTNNKDEIRPIEFTQCKNHETIPERFSTIYSDEEVANFLCIKPGQNITIQNTANELIRRSIIISIYLCAQNLFPFCNTKTDILTSLSSQPIQFSYVLQNDNVDHSSNANPIMPYYFLSHSYPSVNYFTSQFIYWKILTYQSDNGFIFEDNKIDYGVVVDPALTINRSTMKDPSSFYSPIGYYEFGIYPYYADKYLRSYEKFQNVIAYIGGILSVVETVGRVILNGLIGNMFFTSLAQSVYDGSIIYNKNKKYNEGNISNSIGLNNSSMEPIALQLNHNDKHESISVPFKAGKNDTTNKIINISLKSTVKHSNAKNCFYNIRILDYICFYFPFRKNKSKLLISFSREYIKKALIFL